MAVGGGRHIGTSHSGGNGLNILQYVGILKTHQRSNIPQSTQIIHDYPSQPFSLI